MPRTALPTALLIFSALALMPISQGCSALIRFDDADRYSSGMGGETNSGGMGGDSSSGGSGTGGSPSGGSSSGGGSTGGTSSGGGAAVDEHLVHHYTMDEGSGTVVADTGFGPKSDGTASDASTWSNCILGKCYSFENQSYIALSEDVLTSADFTVALWLNRATETTSPILHKFSSGPGGFQLYYSGSQLKVVVGDYQQQQIFVDSPAVLPAPSTGQWVHVAVTFKKNDGSVIDTLQIWVDGVSVKTESKEFGSSSPTNTTDPFWVGRMEGDANAPMQGLIDDLRIYDVALPAEDILALYEDANP